MRLHSMVVTAFGAFAATETVDFDGLAQSGLFLLDGPTGAGKTTVLDAVCFALFGQVPGARQQAGRLRSDHAAADVAPRVVVEATLRGRRVRIDRSPAWDRPKRRGSGTVREQARVIMTELTAGEPIVLSTRLDEVGHLLRGLIGLTCEQFCQVVLLPQGLFDRFLRAGADERRPLLEQVFGTALFTRVEAILADQRRDGSRAVLEALAAVDAMVHRIAQEAGAGVVPEHARDEGSREWVDELWRAALAAADAAERDAASARSDLDRARTEEAAGRAVAAMLARVAEAQARLEQLEAGGPNRAQLAARIAGARAAAPVVPLLALLAVDAREAAAAARVAQQSRRGPGLADEALADAPSGELRIRADERAAELSRLEALRGLAAEAAACSDAADRFASDVAAAQLVVAEHAGWLAEASFARQSLLGRLAAAEHAGAGLASLSAAMAAANARVVAAHRRDLLAARAGALGASAHALRDVALDERQAWLEARARRLDGIAAELAGELRAGEPCAVCGGTEHPSPARRVAGAVSAADERAAEDRSSAAIKRHESARARLEEVGAELAAARVRAGGDDPVEGLLAAAREAERALAAARGIADESETARKALVHHDEETVRRRAEREQALLVVAGTGQARLEVERRRTEMLHTLDAARGDDPSVPARLERLTQLVSVLRASAEAADDATRAATRHRESAVRAASAATAAGFDTPATAAAAALPARAVEEMAATLAAEQHELLAVRSELAAAELRDLPTLAPDVARLTSALQAADGACAQAHTVRSRAVERATALEQLTLALATKLEVLRPLREQHELIRALSTLVDGSAADNALRMRLSSYVLAARLEQVAAAASERLVRMSGGRYTLVHTDQLAGGRTRSGLSLRVCDGWTGLQRDTATLSGGESFVASLSLALGLADVVTAEAGGASLDTLFIDEGFGSLDDETLEEVIDVLDDLRAGGRVVGVVSHVPELRARIPVRLHVRKGTAGSTLATEGVAPTAAADAVTGQREFGAA